METFSNIIIPAFSVLLPASIVLPILIAIIVGIVTNINRRKKYMKTEYYVSTQKPYDVMRRDDGLYGEYTIFKNLSGIEGNKKFLFNCYVPKANGETVEVDVILLCASGIVVFESKNYSGWIFGTESQKMWTQTFPNGHKEKFYNPIMQNQSHIRELRRIFPELDGNVFQSIIVFGEHCQLKKITLTTDNHKVIKSSHVCGVIKEAAGNILLSCENIDTIYSKLYPFTQTSEDQRNAHIASVLNKSQGKADRLDL